MDKGWTRGGQGMDKGWTRDGQEMDHGWIRHGPGMDVEERGKPPALFVPGCACPLSGGEGRCPRAGWDPCRAGSVPQPPALWHSQPMEGSRPSLPPLPAPSPRPPQQPRRAGGDSTGTGTAPCVSRQGRTAIPAGLMSRDTPGDPAPAVPRHLPVPSAVPAQRPAGCRGARARRGAAPRDKPGKTYEPGLGSRRRRGAGGTGAGRRGDPPREASQPAAGALGLRSRCPGRAAR